MLFHKTHFFFESGLLKVELKHAQTHAHTEQQSDSSPSFQVINKSITQRGKPYRGRGKTMLASREQKIEIKYSHLDPLDFDSPRIRRLV